MVEALGVVGTVVAVLAALGGLAVLVGVLIARARTSADESTRDIWKGEAEAQKARGDRLESDIKALVIRVERVEHENTLLRELVTGRQEIADLTRTISAEFAEVKALLTPSPVHNVVNVGGN
jgi:hypothetical protein